MSGDVANPVRKDPGVDFIKPAQDGFGLRLYGEDSGYVGIKPAADAGAADYTLPAVDGIGVWKSDGLGNLTLESGSDTRTRLGLATTDNVTFGDITCTGVIILGETTRIDTEVTVHDPIIKLGADNPSDVLDIGFYGLYTSSGAKYTGLFRDSTDGKWKLFTGLQEEPTTAVNIAGTGYTAGTLVVGTLEATTITGPDGTSVTLGSSLLFSPDASFNIGGAGSNRPQSIFLTHACKIRSDNSASGFFLHNADGTLGHVAISTGTGLQLIDLNAYLFSTSLTPATAESISFYRSREGDSVVSGDVLGELNFLGQANGDVLSARIRALTTGTIADTRVPGKLEFAVGTDAAPTVLTNMLTIDSVGTVMFGLLIFRQVGGVAGTDQIEISHDGSNASIHTRQGYINFSGTDADTRYRFLGASSSVEVRVLSDAVTGLQSVVIGNGNGIAIGVSKQLRFTGGSEAYNVANAGIENPATGVLRITDGSTGAGKLTIGSSSITNAAQLHVVTSGAAVVGAIIAGSSSQSATLLQLNHGATPGVNANYISCTSSGGSEGDRFKVTSAGVVTCDNISFPTGGSVSAGNFTLTLTGGGTSVQCTASGFISTDSTKTLGSSGQRWANVFSTSGNFTGPVTIAPTVTTDVPLTITGAGSQSASLLQLNHGSTPGVNANYLSCTGNGAAEGNIFSIKSDGNVYATSGATTGFTAGNAATIKLALAGGVPGLMTSTGTVKFQHTGSGAAGSIEFYAIDGGTQSIHFRAATQNVQIGTLIANTGSFSFVNCARYIFDNIIVLASVTPASAGATGITGTVAWDSDYVYVCVATNTWKRAAIATW